MNRFCVICDKFVPSYLRMTWSSDEGGYCCPKCAERERLDSDDDFDEECEAA
jgi:hypothetical protein